MNKLFHFLIFSVGFFIFSGFFLDNVYAFTINSDDNYYLQKEQSIDDTLLSRGKTITIDGTVNGDLICAAQSVTINGTIRGDVLCAGMNLKISGTVDGNIRSLG